MQGVTKAPVANWSSVPIGLFSTEDVAGLGVCSDGERLPPQLSVENRSAAGLGERAPLSGRRRARRGWLMPLDVGASFVPGITYISYAETLCATPQNGVGAAGGSLAGQNVTRVHDREVRQKCGGFSSRCEEGQALIGMPMPISLTSPESVAEVSSHGSSWRRRVRRVRLYRGWRRRARVSI